MVHDEGDIGECIARCIALANEMAENDPQVYIPQQFENADNLVAHETGTAQEILRDIDTPIDGFCAGFGTGGTISGVGRVLREAYPDLKANTNFTQLQASLEDTENKISYARQSYNDCVLSYNNAIQTFPAVIFAGIFQFKERQGFEAAEAARQAPTVKF